MAISRTATSQAASSGWVSLGTSYNLSHTCVAGDTMLVVYVLAQTDIVTGVIYNGVSMTQRIKHQANGVVTLYLYSLDNPASGAHNITVSLSASEANGMVCGASYTGTATGAPEATNGNNLASSASISCTLTTTTDNDWLVGGFYMGYPALTGTNASYIAGADNTASMWDTNSAQTPAGSKSMTVTSGTTQSPGGAMMTLQPSVSGPANLKSYNTNLKANTKSINTNLIANVKSFDTNV